MDKARPHVEKGRRFWSGLPRERKIISAIAGLLLAVVAVVAGLSLTPEQHPDSAQAACDAMKDQSNTSAISWYQGRKAAGDSYKQIQSILTDADHKCRSTIGPQMMTIARRMAKDSLNDLLTYQHGGH